jgi:4-amino-4-deoxy-L-arabinose transferase-like glycosyltransferase
VRLLPIPVADLVAALLLTLAAYLLGRALTARMAFASTLEAFALRVPLGLGSLATACFLLGLGGWFMPSVLLGVMALGAIAGVVVAPPRWRWPAALDEGHLAIALLAAALVLPMVVLSLYPPTLWDATSYHLALSKQHLQAGTIAARDFLRYPVFPQLNEILFALGLVLSGDGAAQLVETTMLLLTGVVLLAWGRAIASSFVGLLAAALWLGNPEVILFGTTAFVDAGLALFVVAAAYCLSRWMTLERPGWLMLAAALSGFAAAIKYSALVFVAMYGLMIVARGIGRRRWTPGLLYGAITAAVAIPWYLFNLAYTGNPVFPFLGQIFSLGSWNSTDLREQMGNLSFYGRGRSAAALVALPWDLLRHREFFAMGVGFSPFFCALLPVALVSGIVLKSFRLPLVIAGGYVLFWFHAAQVGRYLFPVVPLLALIAAGGLDRLLGALAPRLSVRWLFAVRVLLVVVFMAPGTAFAFKRAVNLGPLPATTAQRDAFLARFLPSHGAYKFLNNTRGVDYRLYALYLEDMAYFADGCVMGDVFGPARYSRIEGAMGSAEGLARALRELGATHFLAAVERLATRPTQIAHRTLPSDPQQRHLRLVYSTHDIYLFELVEGHASGSSPGAPGVGRWQCPEKPPLASGPAAHR